MINDEHAIAILLVAYNAEQFLSEQTDSIIQQVYTDWILYIRNDGSEDITQLVVDNYAEKFPDKTIQIDKNGQNLGCRGNFFRLFEEIESNYYMFSDADDYWLPEKMQVLYDAIQKLKKEYPDLSLQAFADIIVCDVQLNVPEESHWRSTGINPEKLLPYNYMAVCCNAGGACSIYNNKVKKMVFPLTNDLLIYDSWIAINIAKYGKFKVVRYPLVKYRQHAS